MLRKLFVVVTIMVIVLTSCSLPSKVYTFPPEVPEDLYGTYWLLLTGAVGSNLPGVHTEFTSPTDPTWVRKEAMEVEPSVYVWTWEHNGVVELEIRVKPEDGCVQIGETKLQVFIEKGDKYWDYDILPCGETPETPAPSGGMQS